MNKNIKILILIVFLIKSILLIVWGDFQSMNPDEESNYEIATNYLEGKNYTNNNGELSAFHGSFTVLLYQKLIDNKISKKSYILSYHITALILFLISIPFFYKLLLLLQIQERIALISTIIYSLYPSNIYYIGNLFLYEKVVLPLLICAFYVLYKAFKENHKSVLFWFLPVIVTISCLFRAQLIFIYFIIFITYGIYALAFFKKQKFIKSKVLIFLLTAILIVIAHVPLLSKNHNMFGKHILSTQTGYELMQGHNDLAKGYWDNNWWKTDSPYYEYSNKNINNLNSLNQFEEGTSRKKFALNWIQNNPSKEFILMLKKTYIFMLPRNYESGIHLVNTIIHLAFIIGFFLMLFNKKIDSNSILILSPVIASYLLCQIFFVGWRWRYYAEPFMVIFATYQIFEYVKSQQNLKRQK